MIKAVYVEQYGYWWRLTVTQWQELCERGRRGDGHDLSDRASLKRRPRSIGRTNLSGRPCYYVRGKNVVFYQPLDWEPENYADSLAELAAAGG